MASGGMTDDEIRAGLKELGFDIPVVASTRELCLKKLREGRRVPRTSNSAATGTSKTAPQVRHGARQAERREPSVPASSRRNDCAVGSLAGVSSKKSSSNKLSSMGESSDDYEYEGSGTPSGNGGTQQGFDHYTEALPGHLLRAEKASTEYSTVSTAIAASAQQKTITAAGVAADQHIHQLREHFQTALERPSELNDVCFLAAYGTKVLANRTICAIRCEAMIELLWRQDSFEVEVVSPENSLLAKVNVCLDYSVRALKELVFAASSIGSAQQRLVFRGDELDDSRRLSDYGLVRECRVQLVKSSVAVGAGGASENDCCPVVSVVDMSHIDVVSLRSFLSYLYTATVDVSADNVCGVFILAQRFRMPLLRSECMQFLRDNMDMGNVWLLLKLSHTHCCDDLKLMCLMFVSSNGGFELLEEHVPELSGDLVRFWIARSPQQ